MTETATLAVLVFLESKEEAMRKLGWLVVVIIALGVLFVTNWLTAYSGEADPKNIKYILWTHNLYKISHNQAVATMVGDKNPGRLVVGKTRLQLAERFGPLLSADETSPYNRWCYENSGWKDKRVLFIAESPWMVVFDGDKAVDLVLIKGC